MTGAPNPTPELDEVPHRRRRSTVWKRTPKLVKFALGVCLVALGVSAFLLERRSVQQLPTTPTPDKTFDKLVAMVPKIDLVLSEASLNLKTRAIEGVVTNTSAHAYSDIEITFFVLASDETSSDTLSVSIANLAPHGNSAFVTQPLGNGARTWSVKEIKGTPVSGVPGKVFPPAPGR